MKKNMSRWMVHCSWCCFHVCKNTTGTTPTNALRAAFLYVHWRRATWLASFPSTYACGDAATLVPPPPSLICIRHTRCAAASITSPPRREIFSDRWRWGPLFDIKAHAPTGLWEIWKHKGSNNLVVLQYEICQISRQLNRGSRVVCSVGEGSMSIEEFQHSSKYHFNADWMF